MCTLTATFTVHVSSYAFLWGASSPEMLNLITGMCRRTDAQVSHRASSEYSPPASLLDFWSTWNNSLEDIEDSTVVCIK